ncbi:MAG TPA: hypothetical protein VGE29_20165 [Prosthecobacter sp.]
MTLKLRSPFGWLALAALSAGPLCGQENMLPVSRTAGVLTADLPAGKSTLVGAPFASIVASGTVSAVNAGHLILSSSPAALPVLTATPHAIKITSRVDQRGSTANAPAGTSTNAYGYAAKITAQAGQDVTVALAVAPNVGDEFVIYKLSTLASLFGSTNSAGLQGGDTPAAADIVYVASAGELVGYFYNSTANVWRAVASPAAGDAGATEIGPDAAVLVARKAGGNAAKLTLTGESLPGRQVAQVSAGFQVVNNPFSVSTTLAASGLQNSITGGTSAAGADVIYLEQDGVLTGYYYKTGGLGGTGWRSLSDNLTNQGAALVSPGKAILFKEQAGDVKFVLQEPFAE